MDGNLLSLTDFFGPIFSTKFCKHHATKVLVHEVPGNEASHDTILHIVMVATAIIIPPANKNGQVTSYPLFSDVCQNSRKKSCSWFHTQLGCQFTISKQLAYKRHFGITLLFAMTGLPLITFCVQKFLAECMTW